MLSQKTRMILVLLKVSNKFNSEMQNQMIIAFTPHKKSQKDGYRKKVKLYECPLEA